MRNIYYESEMATPGASRTRKCIGVSSRLKTTKVESISIRGLHDRGIETLAKGDAKRDSRSGDYWHNTIAKTIEKKMKIG